MILKNAFLSLIIVIGILTAVSSPLVAVTMYGTVYVDDSSLGPGHFDDIQKALEAVLPGGTMYIGAGHYILSGVLYIDFDLTIIGAGRDIVLIDGVDGSFALFVSEGADFEISGCTLVNGLGGIMAEATENTVSVHDNTIRSNSGPGIEVFADQGVDDLPMDGFDGEYPNNVLISNNVVHDNGTDGIFVSYEDTMLRLVIEGNTVYDNHGAGIKLDGIMSYVVCEICSNTTYGNGYLSKNTGIHVIDYYDNSLFMEIYENTVFNEDWNGIYIQGASEGFYDLDWYSYNDRFVIHDNEVYLCENNGVCLDFHVALFENMSQDGMDGLNPYGPNLVSAYENDLHDNSLAGILLQINMGAYRLADGRPENVESPDVEASFIVSENEIYDNGGYGILADCNQKFVFLPEGDGAAEETLFYFMVISKNEVYGNDEMGIYVYGMDRLLVENNLVYGNYNDKDLDGMNAEGSGIWMDWCGYGCLVQHNTIFDNIFGVLLINSAPTMLSNIITSCIGAGVYYLDVGDLDGNGYMGMAFNDVWGNGTNYVGMADMTGTYFNISEDPRFFGQFDARLLSVSPCIDTGAPDLIGYVAEDIVGTPRPQGQGIDMGCYEMYDQVWSPHYIQPLAVLSTSRANSMWGCIMENLPTDPSAEAVALIEDIQALMAQTGSLSNPVYTNGLMQQAIELMRELSALLGCGCHS